MLRSACSWMRCGPIAEARQAQHGFLDRRSAHRGRHTRSTGKPLARQPRKADRRRLADPQPSGHGTRTSVACSRGSPSRALWFGLPRCRTRAERAACPCAELTLPGAPTAIVVAVRTPPAAWRSSAHAGVHVGLVVGPADGARRRLRSNIPDRQPKPMSVVPPSPPCAITHVVPALTFAAPQQCRCRPPPRCRTAVDPRQLPARLRIRRREHLRQPVALTAISWLPVARIAASTA